MTLLGDTPACPICGKPDAERFKPFCSKRCAQIDLGRWLKGDYAIPAVEDPEDEGGDSPPGGDEQGTA